MFNDSAVTTKHYTLHAKGNQGVVTLNWKNIRGLGQITGSMGGDPVVGKNYSSGKLTLLCKDVYIELTKVRDGSSFQWQGTGYSAKDCSDFEVVLVPENSRLPDHPAPVFTPGAANSLSGVFDESSF